MEKRITEYTHSLLLNSLFTKVFIGIFYLDIDFYIILYKQNIVTYCSILSSSNSTPSESQHFVQLYERLSTTTKGKANGIR